MDYPNYLKQGFLIGSGVVESPHRTVLQKRMKLLKEIPFDSDTVEVRTGGTTTYDYFGKNKNKGFNITKLLELRGWDKDDCIFFGDKLIPGGNDETVIGVIETVPVDNHRDTFDLIKKYFT